MSKKLIILKKILSLNDGRDKVLKLAQYCAKLLMWILLRKGNLLYDKSDKLSKQFSVTRKCIRLLHWLEPINDAMEMVNNDWFQSFSIGNAIINDLSDDIVCISKIGVIDKKWSEIATPISDRCWFISIFLDVYENLTSTKATKKLLLNEKDAIKQQRLREKLYFLKISLTKLYFDFCFCFIDVFELKVNEGYQICSGLMTAILGTYKLYLKNS